METSKTDAQVDFWSRNPCGTDGALQKKMAPRYHMEPWIPHETQGIPNRNVSIIEVGVAKLRRAIQHGADKVTGHERTIYQWLSSRRVMIDRLGTMLLECFGVPWMYWCTRTEQEMLYSDFSGADIAPCGGKFAFSDRVRNGYNPLGYFYRIAVTT